MTKDPTLPSALEASCPSCGAPATATPHRLGPPLNSVAWEYTYTEPESEETLNRALARLRGTLAGIRNLAKMGGEHALADVVVACDRALDETPKLTLRIENG